MTGTIPNTQAFSKCNSQRGFITIMMVFKQTNIKDIILKNRDKYNTSYPREKIYKILHEGLDKRT